MFKIWLLYLQIILKFIFLQNEIEIQGLNFQNLKVYIHTDNVTIKMLPFSLKKWTVNDRKTTIRKSVFLV